MTTSAVTFLPDPRPDLRTLEDQITELAAHINAATYRFLELVREFDEKNGWEGPGLKSCAHWLNWKCGIGIVAARDKVRVAHALANLPKISQAFKEGRISYSKVRAMTRVATPENEELLLDIALHGTAAHVERVVRGFRLCRRRDEALSDDRKRHLQRNLSWHFDDDGSIVFRGRFAPEAGEMIIKAIQACQEQAFTEGEAPAQESAEEPEYPAGARRADALERMAESYLGGTDGMLNGGERYMLEIHTDAETLQEEGEHASCDIEHHSHASAESCRRMACDCSVVHIIERDGEPLNIGRRTRTIPPAIRRALNARDNGCRFPGCTQERYVDAHHIHHWADGGETSLSNTILLCRRHHVLVHEGGYGVHQRAGDEIYFTDRRGMTIPQCPETRFRGSVAALTDRNRESGPKITPSTAIPRWLGERMDASAVIEALQKRDGISPD